MTTIGIYTGTGLKITIDGTPSWTETTSVSSIADDFQAAVAAYHETTPAPDMQVVVRRYSEADAILGLALVTREPVGGDVADAFAGPAGMTVTSGRPDARDPTAICYTLAPVLPRWVAAQKKSPPGRE